MSEHSKKIVNELCNHLGYDLESPMCRELHEHVQNCPECRQYIDSVKLTVRICKDLHKEVPVPDEVKETLLKKLNLPPSK